MKELQTEKKTWIFIAESENSFSLQDPQRLIEKVRKLQEQDKSVALYYNPLIHTDALFLDAFDAAFPLVNPALQLPSKTVYLGKNLPSHFPIHHLNETPPVFPKITVITRVRNGGKILAQTLKSLRSQTVKDIELHVIDSGSKDDSLEIAKHYGAHVKSISAESYFPGKVLNEALKHTTTDLIVFLNSDSVLLTPTSLEKLLTQFQDPHVSAAFGRQLPRPDAETWVQRDYQLSFPPHPTPPPWIYMSLCLAAIRRTAWEKNPFYTEAWGSEDTQWGYEAKKRGDKIGYSPAALVMHSHNYNLVQLYGRRFIEGEADAFIFNNNFSHLQFFLDWTKSSLREVLLYIKNKEWLSIYKIPIRRFVYNWAYFKGFQLGKKRKQMNISDASKGQKEVLKRYDD